jgi:hypothetical protein
MTIQHARGAKSVDETIEHVLFHCPALAPDRARTYQETVKPSDPVQQLEKCRRLLFKRFGALAIDTPPRSPQA